MTKIDFRLLALPIAYGAALLIMQSVATPYWLWTNIDPSYFYLFNGLEVALGQTPADFYHPGTTTQLIAGLVLRALHPLAGRDALTDWALSNPERALHAMATVNAGLIVAAMIWAGHQAKRAFGGVTIPALLIQATPFLSTVNLVNAYTVKPEATLIALGMVFVGLLCRGLTAPPDARTGVGLGAGLGMVAGSLVMTKLHALSMGVVPVFLLRRIGQKAAYALGGMAALGVFLTVIAPNVGPMIAYFSGVAAHTGAYGQGAAGVLPDHYLWNVFKQLRRPIMSAPMVLGLAVLWLRRKDFNADAEGAADAPKARLLAGVILGQFLHLALIAKNPISYYLIPAFVTMGLSVALTLDLARALAPVSERKWGLALRAVAVLLIFTQTASVIDAMRNRTRERKTSDAVDMTPFAACTKVHFDFSSDRAFALGLGNWMGGYRFAGWLQSHLPADTYIWIPSLGLPQQWGPDQIALPDLVAKAPCTAFKGAWGHQIWDVLDRQLPGVPVHACTNGDEWVLTTGIACEGAFPGRNSLAVK